MKHLEEAPKNIWEYDQEGYNKLTKEDVRFSEMVENERRFVHGLVRYFNPKRILEVGVAEGGGSIVLLNAIEDSPDTTLTSIDLMEQFYRDKSKEVAFACKEKYGVHKQWDLHTGNDPADIIEQLGQEGKFDFCIIDTAHKHPIESLNYLTVFPFLTENCVVVLHDIGMFATACSSKDASIYANFPNSFFATKLLFDTMVGEKKILPVEQYLSELTFSNIGVCQMNQDSKKYIENIFSMLDFPWGMFPDTLESVREIVKKYYSKELFEKFSSAVVANARLYCNGFNGYKMLDMAPHSYGKKKIIFYGNGFYLRGLLPLQEWIFTKNVTEIWDKNADSMDVTLLNEKGYAVSTPDFSCSEKEDILIVITISLEREDIINVIKKELKQNGFSAVLHLNELKSV